MERVYGFSKTETIDLKVTCILTSRSSRYYRIYMDRKPVNSNGGVVIPHDGYIE